MEIDYCTIFRNIFTLFTNLRCLKFNPSSSFRGTLCIDMLPKTNNISSTLLELHVTVFDMEDCLILLYECFDQLRIFSVTVYFISTWINGFNPKVGYFY
jgi:hypothetical protein